MQLVRALLHSNALTYFLLTLTSSRGRPRVPILVYLLTLRCFGAPAAGFPGHFRRPLELPRPRADFARDMLLAAPLVAAWSLQPFPPPHRPHRSRAPICSLDSLFTEQTAELNRRLDLPGEESEASRSLSALHATSIAPLLPAVWSSEFPDRKDAIIKLSIGLDELEVSSSGPLLSGDAFASCDAQCFPTFCLLSWALPRHFGWEEYTTDALFWKRPRLHAWFDLCSYEEPCRDAAAKIERELEAIEYWPEISVDVPTNKQRKLARKDL